MRKVRSGAAASAKTKTLRHAMRECDLCQFNCRETQTIILVKERMTFETCDDCFAQQLQEIVAHWMASPERTLLAERLNRWRAEEKAKTQTIPPTTQPLLHREGDVDLSPADFDCRTSAGRTDIALFRRDGTMARP